MNPAPCCQRIYEWPPAWLRASQAIVCETGLKGAGGDANERSSASNLATRSYSFDISSDCSGFRRALVPGVPSRYSLASQDVPNSPGVTLD